MTDAYFLRELTGLYQDAYSDRGKDIDNEEAEELARKLLDHLKILTVSDMLRAMTRDLQVMNWRQS